MALEPESPQTQSWEGTEPQLCTRLPPFPLPSRRILQLLGDGEERKRETPQEHRAAPGEGPGEVGAPSGTTTRPSAARSATPTPCVSPISGANLARSREALLPPQPRPPPSPSFGEGKEKRLPDRARVRGRERDPEAKEAEEEEEAEEAPSDPADPGWGAGSGEAE